MYFTDQVKLSRRTGPQNRSSIDSQILSTVTSSRLIDEPNQKQPEKKHIFFRVCRWKKDNPAKRYQLKTKVDIDPLDRRRYHPEKRGLGTNLEFLKMRQKETGN